MKNDTNFYDDIGSIVDVAVYARYSSHSQTEQSIEGQVLRCEEFCSRNKYKIKKVYTDRATTGTDDNRPDFLKMIDDSKKKGFQAVVVYAFDRFGRNLEQTKFYESKLRANGVALLSATEPNEDTPAGRFQRNMFMTMAQYFSDELSLKVRRGMNLNGQKCLFTGGVPPLGFKISKDRTFQIDEENAEVAREIFTMYSNDYSVAQICEILNKKGYKTARGGYFQKNSLHRLLINKKYIGIYTYKGVDSKKGAIPSIISDELFESVQKKIKQNREFGGRKPKRVKEEYLLTGKMFCGECGSIMRGFSGTSGHGSKSLYRYYACKNGKAGGCTMKNVSKDAIENFVVEKATKLLSPENIEFIANKIKNLEESGKINNEIFRIRKHLTAEEKNKDNIIEAIEQQDSKDTIPTLVAKLDRVVSGIKDIKASLEEAELYQSATSPEKTKKFLTTLANKDISDPRYKKMIIGLFVRTVVLKDNKIKISFSTGTNESTINYDLIAKEIIAEKRLENSKKTGSTKGSNGDPLGI